MKKFALLFTSVVLLAGCKQAVAPTTPTVDNSQSESAASSQIAAAISSGQPISCTMTKKDGTSSMQYMMKDKKMKITGIVAQGTTTPASMISDGSFMYTWDATTKQGMKIALSTDGQLSEEDRQKTGDIPSINSDADKKKLEDEGYTVDCNAATIDDAEFVPPTDVKFSDFSTLMQKSKVMMQNKTGDESQQSPEEMQKQAQEMMKQYQQ